MIWFSWFLSQPVHFWYIEKLLNCVLLLCWKCLSDLRDFFFLVEPLGSFKYKTVSSTNRDNLTSSFPIRIPFISFSCLLLWLRIQALYWIRVERGDTLVSFQTLEGMASVLPHLMQCWLCFIIYSLYYVEVRSL
jgi:hypothetical protein